MDSFKVLGRSVWSKLSGLSLPFGGGRGDFHKSCRPCENFAAHRRCPIFAAYEREEQKKSQKFALCTAVRSFPSTFRTVCLISAPGRSSVSGRFDRSPYRQRRYPASAVLQASPPPHERPASPSRASGWSSLTALWGFPCCARFPCVRAAASTPVQRLGVVFAHLTQPYQPSPKLQSGRPAHRPFRGLLGIHSRCGPHTRAATYM